MAYLEKEPSDKRRSPQGKWEPRHTVSAVPATKTRGETLISVVIPARGAAIEPWFTVSCCLMDLESHDPEDYEIIVVFNGEAPPKGWVLHNHPCVKYAFAGATVDSPQAARAMGFEMSSGETVFFLDSHVLMPSGFFDGVLRDMYDSGADFMGVAARFD